MTYLLFCTRNAWFLCLDPYWRILWARIRYAVWQKFAKNMLAEVKNC